MRKRLVIHLWFMAMAAVLVLGACGSELSGEPQIVSEAEIVSLPTPAVTDTPEPIGTLTVRGRLIQGTGDGDPIPAGLAVELLVLDAQGEIAGEYEALTGAGGAFVFEDVVRAPEYAYFVHIGYAGVTQGAQIAPIRGDEEDLSLDVIIYERSTDPVPVAVTRAQMLITYAPINEFGIEVRLDLELINTGDRIVTTDMVADNGWPVSVQIELPVGAFSIQPMQIEGSERYQVDENNALVWDTWPLHPDQVHSITLLYYLPYTSEAVLDQAFGYAVMNGAVLLPNDTVTLDSEQFETDGEFRYRVLSGGLRITRLEPDEDISPDDTTLIKAHDLLGPLSADERLIFTLSGRPSRTVDVIKPVYEPDDGDDSTSSLLLVLGGIGVVVLLAGIVLWWRQRRASVMVPLVGEMPGPAASKDALLRALADLDDAFDAGQVNEATYHARRAALKQRLLPLMDDETDQ
ncbi:MAG: hypothetical protein JXJ20_03785 [Anaerolineae bacterium]|nr:hypothetical protein [Anaerolineae bacterium]